MIGDMSNSVRVTRRVVLGSMAAVAGAAAQRQRRAVWKPKLGVTARYSEANIEFLREEGFTSVQLGVDRGALDPTMPDEKLQAIRQSVSKAGLYLSSLLMVQNHIAPEPEARDRAIKQFRAAIELTGKMGVPYLSTASGTMPGRPLAEQVKEIVRVYTENYFPLCETHKVRILWEPWAGGPNIATGPVGYEALFEAFGDSPHVGLQYDPSHLAWQMMDPIQCARDFIGKIYDVHLKDTEIMWPVLRKTGTNPLSRTRWWRFRLPGSGCVDWPAFFTVLQDAGYQGAMNIEHEDELYYPPYANGDFTEQFKTGLRMAHRFLRQYVPA